MEIEQITTVPETFSEKLKAIPKKHWIIAGILLLVLIILVTAYFVGKGKPQVTPEKTTGKPVEDVEFDDVETEDDKPRTVNPIFGKTLLSENEVFQLDIDGLISWQEGSNYLDMPRNTYFRHKKKYKENAGIS